MSHDARVERRTDGAFIAIVQGEAVFPNEPIRLSTSGIRNQSVNPPRFVIYNASGIEVFNQQVTANAAGNAWIDITGPGLEGDYTLTVHAQTYPFLPFTHEANFAFSVSQSAVPPPPPPPPPPGGGVVGIFTDVNSTVRLVSLAVLGIVLVPRVLDIFTPPRR